MPNFLASMNRVTSAQDMAEMVKDGCGMICIVGHLTRDPETRYTLNGKAITRGAVAVSWGKRNDPQRETRYFSFNAWERESDIIAQFGKGDAVLLIGKPSVREYNGKEYAELTVWSVATPVWKTDEKPDRGMPPIPPSENGQKRQAVDDDPEIPF